MNKLQKVAYGLAKFTVLFTTAVYILALPFYWVLVAEPLGQVDALMPFEAALCLFLSALFFAWSGKTAARTVRIAFV